MVPLLITVALLFSFGCRNGGSPLEPTPTSTAPIVEEFRLTGSVSDTAWRPLGGATVEIVTGTRAGTVTLTDQHGRFSMPDVFTGVLTLRASRDGYVSETSTVPPNVPSNRPVPALGVGEVRHWDTSFSLQPDGPSTDIAGVYSLTLSADRTCTGLPDEARTRTYTATIVSGSRSTRFVGQLSDARIIRSTFGPYLEIGIAGDFANVSMRLVEQLSATTYLAIEGAAAGSITPSGITAPFNSYFLQCPGEPVWASGEYWWCGAETQGVECNSPGNQLTLVRR